jgi:hypothetical protein
MARIVSPASVSTLLTLPQQSILANFRMFRTLIIFFFELNRVTNAPSRAAGALLPRKARCGGSRTQVLSSRNQVNISRDLEEHDIQEEGS